MPKTQKPIPENIREKAILDGPNTKFSTLFIESYQKLVKHSFSANKIKRCAKFIRKSYLVFNFFSCYYHLDFVNITCKFSRSTLKNYFFSSFDIQPNKPAKAAVEDRDTCTGIHYSGSIDPFTISNNRNSYGWIIRTAKQLIRKPHNMLISSSFLGTFMTITFSKESPFFLSISSTSDAESAEVTIPLSVTAIHLPLYFSAYSECDDNHFSSSILFAFGYRISNENDYLKFIKMSKTRSVFEHAQKSKKSSISDMSRNLQLNSFLGSVDFASISSLLLRNSFFSFSGANQSTPSINVIFGVDETLNSITNQEEVNYVLS